MHWCYSKCVCVSLGRHPDLIIFRILDSVSSLAIILFGMGSRLYYSFGFLFVNPVLYTSVEEHNSKLCPWFCTVHPCCIFPLININMHLLRTFVYGETAFTRSQANVEQRNLDRLCSKVEGNFSLQLLHNWSSKMIHRLKIEWKVISNRSADQHLFVKSYLWRSRDNLWQRWRRLPEVFYCTRGWRYGLRHSSSAWRTWAIL